MTNERLDSNELFEQVEPVEFATRAPGLVQELNSVSETSIRGRRYSWVPKFALAIGLIAIGLGVFWGLGGSLSLERLAANEAALRGYQASHPVLVIVIALILYVLVTGLSLPGATPLTLTYAWFFGFWWGLLLVSFASTAGATTAFLVTRYLLGARIQARFAAQLRVFNESFDREGAFYLFSLRLIPAVPFFVINAAMGLTRIRVRTFWWVSQLGMLPGTVAYVYAGSTVPSLQQLAEQGASSIVSWQLIVAFVILGCLPLVIKRLLPLCQTAWRKKSVTAKTT